MQENKSSILLCLDLEVGSEELLRRGLQYARRLGNPLDILYVLPVSSVEEESSAVRRLEEMVDRVGGVAAGKTIIKHGCAEDEIVDYMDSEPVELVILGHRHKARRERVHVGSTVGTVISLAPGAILVLALDGEG